ncbi:hypothetical protein AKN87_02005 [Thiopseudomonas alkaliphila]|uniref:DUF6691 family protein n=1 Tax=Thiopseudomonas alkaliphila TaxID=1697053 RepID=UPI00069ECC78|nr:DUF6691 family protein [Thiopseudomonas alkaliphila]AKX44014.1 hypothetical protein AKN87_02005 [Thiopseudomonas alkaliphila]AKX49321.1 hypothetical protein AKN93_07845 [Thiopseudomonas alkaliphila]
MRNLAALICGLVFGIGLLVAGMHQPTKVQGFLDIAGNWDPSLAFVMGGAIATALGFFMVAGKRGKAVLGGPVQLPTRRDIDKPLVIGSALFGIGWGLAGICPGPVVVTLSLLNWQTLVFLAALLVTMKAYDFIVKK